MKRLGPASLIISLSLFFPFTSTAEEFPYPKVYTVELETEYHTIDRIYKSMIGPEDVIKFQLLPGSKTELAWMIGADLEVIDAEGNVTDGEFICHTSFYSELPSIFKDEIDIGPTDPFGAFSHSMRKAEPDDSHHAHHAHHAHHSDHHGEDDHEMHLPKGSLGFKYLDINQGTTHIRFPRGFGIAQLSNEPLVFNTMLMNHYGDREPFDLKIRGKVYYVLDKELDFEMKALDTHILQVELSFDGQTGAHWLVSPGRYQYTTDFPDGLKTASDIRVHMITAHLHPYAESIELIDHTTGKSVFKANALNFEDRVGLKTIDFLTSEEGILLAKNHHYELVTIYNNPKAEKIDAMGMLYLYYHEPSFDKTLVREGL